MAIQKGFYFIGKTGNLSNYLWKDIPCTRAIPAKVHQGEVVKNNSRVNGLATRMGGSFRGQLKSALPFPKNFDMQTRFRGALRNWLKYNPQTSLPPNNILQSLNNFSFNQAASLQGIFRLPLVLTLATPAELLLQIPSFIASKSIASPEGATSVKVMIIASSCHINTTLPIDKAEHVLTYPCNDTRQPAQDIFLPLQMPANSLTLVVMSLVFTSNQPGNTTTIDKHWLPCEVIGGVARVGE